jgi:hypothetical protein
MKGEQKLGNTKCEDSHFYTAKESMRHRRRIIPLRQSGSRITLSVIVKMIMGQEGHGPLCAARVYILYIHDPRPTQLRMYCTFSLIELDIA